MYNIIFLFYNLIVLLMQRRINSQITHSKKDLISIYLGIL